MQIYIYTINSKVYSFHVSTQRIWINEVFVLEIILDKAWLVS